MPLWTPSRLTNVYGWYSSAGLSGSDYAEVISLSDLSGNARTLTNNTGARPWLRTAAGARLNGLPVIEFDGNIRTLIRDLGSELAVAGLHTFVVYRTTTAKNNTRIFEISGRTTHTAQTAGFSQGVTTISSTLDGWRVNIQGRLATVATRYWQIAGDLQHTGSSPFQLALPPWAVNTNFTLIGNFAELIITAFQDTETRQLIEGYIHWQWGLQSQLANDHPYKNAAPTYGDNRRRQHAGAYGL